MYNDIRRSSSTYSRFRHEHLYEKIGPKIIVSDKFPKTTSDAESKLEGAKVILCTLSMLSNPKCSVFTTVVPVETVIVDEASQIEIGNYVPLVYLFKTTVSKLVFIGDDKQCTPTFFSFFFFNEHRLISMRSAAVWTREYTWASERIRDISLAIKGQASCSTMHVSFRLVLIRLQTDSSPSSDRMPRVVGAFISRHVYAGQLKTEHPIASANACRFIDVPKGKEEKYGHSWVVCISHP